MDHIPPDRKIAGEPNRAGAVLPTAAHSATRGPQRDSPRADLPRMPLTTAELIKDGVSPEFLASMALRRASSGRVATSGGHYFDHGHPMPSYLTGAFDELADAGLLTMAQEDPGGLRRIRLTQAGHARYAQNRLVCNNLADGCASPSVIRQCRCGVQLWVSLVMLPTVEAGHQPPEMR